MPALDGKDVKINVDRSKCIVCGQCVNVCPCEYLAVVDGKVVERKDPPLGCLVCGHCAAVCPRAAILVESEDFKREDVFEFFAGAPASYETLLRLFESRRSIRKFEDKAVPPEVLSRILEAAQQAPAGLPPSDVKVHVLDGKDKVRAFAFDFLDEAGKMAWLFSKAGIWLLRPWMSAKEHREMREKVAPLYRGLVQGRRDNKDFLFYDAPLAMIFTTHSGDPADPTIAATYAMIAAESLGLGSCMIGTVMPMLPRIGQGFRDKYQISSAEKQGLAIIFGYSTVKFHRAVRRRFADIVQH